MLHLKNTGFSPSDTGYLLSKARTLGKDCIIRDCRVSTKYIEFDVSIQKSRIDQLVAKLNPIAPLDHARQIFEEHIPKEEAIKKGILYFNDERFWEAHEVLEGVWKKCYAEEKILVQAIILIAAALVHFQKAENSICLSVLERASKKLQGSSGMYYGINVDRLIEKLKAIQNSEKITLFTM